PRRARRRRRARNPKARHRESRRGSRQDARSVDRISWPRSTHPQPICSLDLERFDITTAPERPRAPPFAGTVLVGLAAASEGSKRAGNSRLHWNHPPSELVGRDGIEPPTPGFSDPSEAILSVAICRNRHKPWSAGHRNE